MTFNISFSFSEACADSVCKKFFSHVYACLSDWSPVIVRMSVEINVELIGADFVRLARALMRTTCEY